MRPSSFVQTFFGIPQVKYKREWYRARVGLLSVFIQWNSLDVADNTSKQDKDKN